LCFSTAAALLCGAVSVLAQTPRPSAVQSTGHAVRALELNESRYTLRAGERIVIGAPAETADFLLAAKKRTARTPNRNFPVAPNASGDHVLIGVPLTTPPGEYSVAISAIAASGEERIATVSITVNALPTVPLNSTTPPVVLVDGWQPPSLTSLCPMSNSSAGTFDNLEAYLYGSPNFAPVVYFFENCTECPNCAIEQLGADLGAFLNSILYSNGTPVPQVDVIAHSMGGLIVRSYLSGKQEVSGAFSPPSFVKIRKAVFVGTPHFGSFQADSLLADIVFGLGEQTDEMKRGSQFVWDLATWNQFGEDLRGVDAIAVIGNAGSLGNLSAASDGVVALTSGSLDFVTPGRTRIVNDCHVPPAGIEATYLGCTGSGIAYINGTAHPTYQILSSFLAGGDTWKTVGTMPSADPYLSKYGGMVVADVNANEQYVTPSAVSWGPSISLTPGAAPELYYNDFVSGTATFGFGSSNCGPYTQTAGVYSAVRCKSAPTAYSVGPLVSGTGRTVQAGATITIAGTGFGAQQCAACKVTASHPQSSVLQISGWSNTSISAFLPSAFVGIAQIGITTANGFEAINIMGAPAPASLITIQTNPSGLQFSIDGGMLLAAPQTLSLVTGSTHSVAVASAQPGATGTQYVFTGWSDGGAASHSFVASASGTLTATFQTQYQLTLSASPATGGTVTPASGSFYNSGAAVSITATANGGYAFTNWTGNVASSSAASTTVTMGAPQMVTANFVSTAPAINTGGIVPLYSSVPTIQPGSWVSIYGSKLANTTAVWDGSFPVSLGGVSVTIDNKPGYLWLVSPGQINLQAPDDTATGPVNVTVTTPNGTVSSTVTLAAFGPSFSLLSAKYAAGVILTPNGSGAYGGGAYDLLGPSGTFSYNTRPVKAGETLELYGVGFGPTNPHVPAGAAYGGAAPTTNTVTVTIGGVSATVLFSGITTTGLYQFNIVVPSAGKGDQLLQASVGGVPTPGGVYVTLQ
jgi:uncharacterized protein (TIGR03437 family)